MKTCGLIILSILKLVISQDENSSLELFGHNGTECENTIHTSDFGVIKVSELQHGCAVKLKADWGSRISLVIKPYDAVFLDEEHIMLTGEFESTSQIVIGKNRLGYQKLITEQNNLKIVYNNLNQTGFAGSEKFELEWNVIKPQEINECGSVSLQTGDSGVLTSMNYPQNYENNADCEWAIEVDEGSRILLSFNETDIFSLEENDSECKFDFITIKEGENLDRFCDNSKEYMTVGNRAMVNFKSDAYGVNSGFKINWIKIESPKISGKNFCGGEIIQKGTKGEISSYGYPNFNDFEMLCKWEFDLGDEYELEFTLDYDIETGPYSMKPFLLQFQDHDEIPFIDYKLHDRVKILFDTEATKTDLINPLSEVTRTKSSVKVLYMTDNKSYTRDKFRFKWRAIRIPQIQEETSICDTGFIHSSNETIVVSSNTAKNCDIRLAVPSEKVININFESIYLRSGCLNFEVLSTKTGFESLRGVSDYKICSKSDGLRILDFNEFQNESLTFDSDVIRISATEFIGSVQMNAIALAPNVTEFKIGNLPSPIPQIQEKSLLEKLQESLTGICATGQNAVGDHTFTVCPFDKITQTTSRSTYNIGFYDDNNVELWDEEAKTLMMVDGTDCGSPGNRKAKIQFVCDSDFEENTISKTSEPSTCFYTMNWYTDLVC